MRNTKLTDRQLKEFSLSFFSAIDRLSENRMHLRIFFNALLTRSEYRSLLIRWRILQMLSQRIAQRDIISELGVSSGKVARGSEILFGVWGEFAKIRERIRL